MYKIKKTFRVSTGHRLSKHKGLCQNIHGHNLTIKVTLVAEELDSNDMVMDFHDLSKIMQPLLNSLDHTLLLNSKDHKTITYAVENRLLYRAFIDQDPTAEVIAKYIFDSLEGSLENQNRVKVNKVKIYENDDAVAEYKKK